MELYQISLRGHKTNISKLVSENEKCYASLKNKGTMYARQVKALGDLHRQVKDIYMSAPKDVE